ncbi:uncharacterized protein Tco_0571127 [Tanacetum coccineum]
MKACVTRVSRSIDHIKECYIGMKTYPDSKLVKMMVTDACFILAFINIYAVHESSLGENVLFYAHIFLDMVLLENQIPFFVLQELYECTLWKLHPKVHVANFISVNQENCKIFEGDLAMGNSHISSMHDHILGFLHKSFQNPNGHSSIVPKIEKGQSVVELDRLDTPEDVAKMVKSKVLIKYLGSDEEGAGVINNICKEVTISENSIIESNGRYWKNTTIAVLNNWAYMIAGLRRRYFGNPWSIIALIAGIILFVLTVVVQTVYGVKVA